MFGRAGSSPAVGVTALALAAVLIAGCSSPDDEAEDTIDTTAPPAATSLAPALATATVESAPTSTLVLPPGASQPGPRRTPTITSDSPASNGPTSVAGIGTGGYRSVDPEALLHLGEDGISDSVDEPLADGIYYASTYEPTADRSGVRFNLARFYTTEACIATLDTVPEGTVDESGCYGGSVDTSATAVVTLRLDNEVPVILVSADYKFLEVTDEEFARLLSGEPPAPDAPAWYEYQPYWDALVEVADGTVVRANQRPSS